MSDWKGGYIYILKRDGVVVYVGQSKNKKSLRGRINRHSKDKDFDSWACRETNDLDSEEGKYIIQYLPEYNLSMPTNDLVASYYCIDRILSPKIKEIMQAKSDTGHLNMHSFSDGDIEFNVTVTVQEMRDMVAEIRKKRIESEKRRWGGYDR